MQVSQKHLLDRGTAVFDDPNLVSDAGLGLAGLLIDRLGIELIAEQAISEGYRPGRKAVTVVAGMLLGADSIDDLDELRAGATERMLVSRVMAPSTIGSWLRSMELGQLSQLDRVMDLSLAAAWQAGAGPEPGSDVTLDLDSSVKEVFGVKQGAGYAYEGTHGLHPQFVTLRQTGEQIMVRLRGGSANAGRAAASLVRTSVNRVRSAAPSELGRITIGGDSAFYQHAVFAEAVRLGVFYSISARDTPLVRTSWEAIAETAWRSIDYAGGQAQVAEIAMPEHPKQRLIVRRVRNIDASKRRIGGQAQLFATWKMIAFVTNLPGDAIELDAEHRKRARQELSFADLKDNAFAHLPSASFVANAAWLTFACLAQNLVRWAAQIGLGQRGLIVTRTVRRQLFAIPGRLARSARRTTLHMPLQWPWRDLYLRALRRIRGITPKLA